MAFNTFVTNPCWRGFGVVYLKLISAYSDFIVFPRIRSREYSISYDFKHHVQELTVGEGLVL